MEVLNLKNIGVRGVNSALHDVPEDRKENFEILNPQGQHSIACGINAPLSVKVKGHTTKRRPRQRKVDRLASSIFRDIY